MHTYGNEFKMIKLISTLRDLFTKAGSYSLPPLFALPISMNDFEHGRSRLIRQFGAS